MDNCFVMSVVLIWLVQLLEKRKKQLCLLELTVLTFHNLWGRTHTHI